MAGAMGEVALSATELAAWASGNCVQLTGWEFGAIMSASNAYASEKYAARNAARPSPLVQTLDDGQKQAVARNVRNILRD